MWNPRVERERERERALSSKMKYKKGCYYDVLRTDVFPRVHAETGTPTRMNGSLFVFFKKI
jgi:hypothetical protein